MRLPLVFWQHQLINKRMIIGRLNLPCRATLLPMVIPMTTTTTMTTGAPRPYHHVCRHLFNSVIKNCNVPLMDNETNPNIMTIVLTKPQRYPPPFFHPLSNCLGIHPLLVANRLPRGLQPVATTTTTTTTTTTRRRRRKRKQRKRSRHGANQCPKLPTPPLLPLQAAAAATIVTRKRRERHHPCWNECNRTMHPLQQHPPTCYGRHPTRCSNECICRRCANNNRLTGPIHSLDPPGGTQGTMKNNNRLTGPIHSLDPPGGTQGTKKNRNNNNRLTAPIHSLDPPGGTQGTKKNRNNNNRVTGPIHSLDPPGGTQGTTTNSNTESTCLSTHPRLVGTHPAHRACLSWQPMPLFVPRWDRTSRRPTSRMTISTVS